MANTRLSTFVAAMALAGAPALAQTTHPPATAPSAGTPAPAAAKLSADEFVKDAAMSGMFEIESSKAILGKTQDAAIRDFAQHMVKDHTAADAKLKDAAKGKTVPTALDEEHAAKLKQLQQASGSEMDAKYVSMQLAGHRQAVSMFDSYARDGDDATLKQFAAATLPTLREHLKSITQIQSTASAQPAKPDATAAARSATNAGAVAIAPANTTAAASAGGAAAGFITNPPADTWRASKLVGVDVYNENNEKIGDIDEVLVNREGKIDSVIIGVGGFLGMGEHDVAVPFASLQWVDQPVGSRVASTAPAATTTTTAVPPSTAPARTPSAAAPATTAPAPRTTASADRGYPDHAVLPNASKDQLKAAPAFKYSSR
jgi:predicted outer membrane protein/sporulation protein YlmC with PRC-barrel domain